MVNFIRNIASIRLSVLDSCYFSVVILITFYFVLILLSPSLPAYFLTKNKINKDKVILMDATLRVLSPVRPLSLPYQDDDR